MKRSLRHVVRGKGPRRRIGLSRIHPEDTFVVSFPKSGNTWVRFLIACMQDPETEVSFRNIESFIRCGEEGQWRDAEIASALAPFIERAEPALSSLGYTV